MYTRKSYFYNLNIKNKGKKLIGSFVYFAILLLCLFISEVFYPNLSVILHISITPYYNLARELLYNLFMIPLLCGFVMFLIDENGTLKTIFCCYKSKQKLLNAMFIFVVSYLPILILLYINYTTMNKQIQIVILLICLILRIQAEYLIINFSRNKDEKMRLRLFFKNIDYKKLIITELIFFPILVISIIFRFAFEGGIVQPDNLISYYISSVILYGFNIVVKPIYYTLFNNNVVIY